jgi:hypothetical protein
MTRNIIFTGIIALAVHATLSAQSTPRIDERQENQKERIIDGVQNKELTRREARQLRKQQAHVRRLERRANADGTVNAAEQVRIEKAQDRSSRNIARKKHNKRDRN